MSNVSEWARLVCVNTPGDDFITIGIVAWDDKKVVGDFVSDWDKITAFHTGDANAIKEALEAVRRKVVDKRFNARDVEKLRKMPGTFRMLTPVGENTLVEESLSKASDRYFGYVKPFRAPVDTGDF